MRCDCGAYLRNDAMECPDCGTFTSFTIQTGQPLAAKQRKTKRESPMEQARRLASTVQGNEAACRYALLMMYYRGKMER